MVDVGIVTKFTLKTVSNKIWAQGKIVDGVEAVTKKNGTYLDFKYSNYSFRDQNPLASYGAENLQKLTSIAKSYDLEGAFQTLQNGGWQIGRAHV